MHLLYCNPSLIKQLFEVLIFFAWSVCLSLQQLYLSVVIHLFIDHHFVSYCLYLILGWNEARPFVPINTKFDILLLHNL